MNEYNKWDMVADFWKWGRGLGEETGRREEDKVKGNGQIMLYACTNSLKWTSLCIANIHEEKNYWQRGKIKNSFRALFLFTYLCVSTRT